MNLFDKNFKEIFSSQIVLVLCGLFSGTILAMYTNNILLIPGIIIMLPGFLEMRGNISGSLASRISSGLFLGVIKPHKYRTKIIKGNMIASFLLVLIVAFALGLLSFAFVYIVFKQTIIKLIILPLVAAVIANIIEIPLTLFTTFYLFNKGHDPNNIMAPFVSTTGDITSIISLLIALVIL